jgi:hypothetical protein
MGVLALDSTQALRAGQAVENRPTAASGKGQAAIRPSEVERVRCARVAPTAARFVNRQWSLMAVADR